MNLRDESLSWPVTRLKHTLENLLFFLEVPDAATTSRPEWLETMTADIRHDFASLIVDVKDAEESENLRRRKVDATHFANVLHANPGINIANWTKDFPDCLGRLRAFVRELERIEAGDNGERIPDEIPKAGSTTVSAFAVATDTVPDAYRDEHGEIGPLVGTCAALLGSVSNVKRRGTKELLSRHKNGMNFVKRLKPNGRTFEMFFRTRTEYVKAKAKFETSTASN